MNESQKNFFWIYTLKQKMNSGYKNSNLSLNNKSESFLYQLKKKLLKFLLYLTLFFLIIPPYILPVDGRITSRFFLRLKPEKRLVPSLEFHSGIDIAAAKGTTIKAAKSGFVIRTGSGGGYGNFVIVKHWLGFSTLYAHMDSIKVKKGDLVFKWWSILGYVGSTGRSTGNHLHFEVRWRGYRLPPTFFCVFDIARGWIFSLFLKIID